MWKFVQLILWIIVFVYLMNLNENLDARGGAAGDAPDKSHSAYQARGASEVHSQESTR
jgi:hypothetical protein